jgi:predicted ATPase/DNA-binding CsgD family transcriptional regulator
MLAQLTPFIGRTDEVQEIIRLLADPACRLLTLVGGGGIGKTRLAIQVAAEIPGNFADGVYFVPLQAIESTHFFISTLADTLKLPLTDHEDPVVQLLTYLRDKEILFVLDNFEQLLTPSEEGTSGEEILSEILAAASRLKLLVTSRAVLNLQEEWLYPVQGLPFPDAPLLAEEASWEQYSAIQLFVERARRVRRDFSLADELAEVVRICQLVEGVPLALELAASWTKTLRCADIAAEIERNLNFLATTRHNVPERQRSVRATFDYCWQRLGEKERTVFERLSVFRGSFRREAAERVAGASLITLTVLTDKSFLYWQPDGRYHMHELLRQYAAEQLVLSLEDVAQIYDAHCDFYTDFLHKRLKDLQGGRQREAIAEITAELENIRAAWQWAVELANVAAIEKAREALGLIFQFQGRYLEGTRALEKAVESLRREDIIASNELLLAKLLVGVGWFYIRLGRLAEAEAVLLEAQGLSRHLDVPPGYGSDPHLPLGVLASIRGDYAELARLAEEARQVSEAHPHRLNREFVYYLLARAALLQGQYEAGHQYAHQAYLITQETQDRWFMAYCLNELGNVACALGDYAAAKIHYQSSYALREEFGDPEGMALALNHLAEIALLQAAYAEAGQLYQRSLAFYRQTNDRGGLATSLNGLAQVAVAHGDYPAAQQQFQQALQIAAEIHFVPLILSVLVGVAELLLRVGRVEGGLELLTLTSSHPAGDYQIKAKIQHLLKRYEVSNLPEIEPGLASGLQNVIEVVQNELAASFQAEGQIISSAPPPDAPRPAILRPAALIEPLTSRELEILQLIAAGLSNPEIAAALIITTGTVKAHTHRIYGKLNAANRVQAIVQARELGLL